MNHIPLRGLAGGKVCAVLEGGYFPPSLAESAALTLRSLLGDPVPPLPLPLLSQPNSCMKESVRNKALSFLSH